MINQALINSEVTHGNYGLEMLLRTMAIQEASLPIVGNVYYVVPTAQSNYVQFVKYYQRKYEDSSEMIQTTLAAAMTACVANRGDVIFLAPGFTLAVSSATGLLFNKAGVTIIGMGSGLNRPTITLDTAATATIAVSAANIQMHNVIVTANFADIVSAFTLAAAKDFNLHKCDFLATAVDMNFLHIIDTNTTDNSYDGLRVTECNWLEVDAATLAFMLADASAVRVNISDNVMNTGNATADIAALVTFAAGKIWTHARIMRNNVSIVGNAGSTAGLFMTTNSTTHTGLETDNFLSHIDATTELFQTANMGFGLNNNKATGVKATQGYLLPAADA